jgi:hypothetical protein
MKGDPVVKSCANVFTVPHQTTEVIDELGCQVMAVICGGKCTDSLAALRCKIMSKKVPAPFFIIRHPRASASNWICHQTSLPKNVLSNHGLDGYGRWYNNINNNNNNNKLYLKKVQLYKNQFSDANLTLGLLFNCYRPLITNLLLKLHIKLDISTTSTNKSRTNK